MLEYSSKRALLAAIEATNRNHLLNTVMGNEIATIAGFIGYMWKLAVDKFKNIRLSIKYCIMVTKWVRSRKKWCWGS